MKYLFNESINPLGGSKETPCSNAPPESCATQTCFGQESCGPFCATKCSQLPLNCSCTTQNGDVEQGCLLWFELG